MGVFDQAVATGTRANGYAGDNGAPPMGNLNAKAMMSPTALAGTNGVDVWLIHGDKWEQTLGNLTSNILKNVKTTITLNEMHTVLTNVVKKVVGTTNDTRVGVHNQTNIAPRNDVFMHTRAETHHQTENRQQLTGDQNHTKDEKTWLEEHFEWTGYKLELKNITVELCAPLSYEKKLFGVGNDIFHMGHEEIEVEMKEITTSLGALATEIKGGKIKAAASHLKAIAGNINAGIALNMDSPFG